MEHYNGIIIGFCNQKKKRVCNGIKENLKYSNFKIHKFNGFTANNKEQLQLELKALIKQHNQVNTIYMVLKYDRIDNMRKKLQLLIDHFQNYLDNLCLIISNFQLSQNRDFDQILISTKLKDYFKIPQCIHYDIGTNPTKDKIQMENRMVNFDDFIYKTLFNHNNKVTLNSKSMDLDIKINHDLLDELNRTVQKQLTIKKNQEQIKKNQTNYYEISNEMMESKQQIPQTIPTFFQDRKRAISNNNQQSYLPPQQQMNPQKKHIFNNYYLLPFVQKKLF